MEYAELLSIYEHARRLREDLAAIRATIHLTYTYTGEVLARARQMQSLDPTAGRAHHRRLCPPGPVLLY